MIETPSVFTAYHQKRYIHYFERQIIIYIISQSNIFVLNQNQQNDFQLFKFFFFFAEKLLNLKFSDLKCSTLEMQVSNFLNPMENKVFQFSFYDFVKTSLTKHFLPL